jgi:hypothetical protein
MAPYAPPSSHYAHLKVDLYDDKMLEAFMGQRGCTFYNLTLDLKVLYIWCNKPSKIIEVWGPYESFRDLKPVDVINQKLDQFVEKEYFTKNV